MVVAKQRGSKTMNTTPIRKYMADIKNLQEKLSKFVRLRDYTPQLLACDQSFIRFLCTKFKMEFYKKLINKPTKQIDKIIPFKNLLFLVKQDLWDGLKFYTTLDQINYIYNKFGKEKLIFWLRLVNKDGLAYKTIENVEGTDYAYFVHHNWHKSPVYQVDRYRKEFQQELEIYDVQESSTLIIFSLPKIQFCVISTKKLDGDIVNKCYQIMESGEWEFLRLLNEIWKLLLIDQELWEHFWGPEAPAPLTLVQTMAFANAQCKANEIANTSNYSLEEDDRVIETFESLFDQTQLFENKKKELMENKNVNYDEFHPIDYTKSECSSFFRQQEVHKCGAFRSWCCTRERRIQFWENFTSIPEMVYHNEIHSECMERIAAAWCSSLEAKFKLNNKYPNREVYSCLIYAIWLHDIGMKEYAQLWEPGHTIQNIDSASIRKAHSYYGSQRIEYELKKDLKKVHDMSDDDLEIVKQLVYYHSKAAPLDGNDNIIGDIHLVALTKILSTVLNNLQYPYFTMIALIRCVDAIDVGVTRCGSSPTDRYKKTKGTIQANFSTEDIKRHYRKQIFHYIKHGCIQDLTLEGLDDQNVLGCSVTYYPDLLQPSFLVFYAFGKADFDIQKEIEKLDVETVKKYISNELDKDIQFVKVNNMLAGAEDSLLDKDAVKQLRGFVKNIYKFKGK